ncbi:MAG TPA: hypothetical protein VM308_04890 [Sphingomicrobium sp.]|nr:hypothetical protein [Sphingomicrobium sp.]
MLGTLVGAALVSASMVAARVLKDQSPQTKQPASLLAVTYTKPDGPFENVSFKGVSDPAPTKEPTPYLVEVARRCRITAYHLEDNAGVTDVNSSARWYTRLAALSDDAFNCLTEASRPPYLRIEKTFERCELGGAADQPITLGSGEHVPASPICLSRQG